MRDLHWRMDKIPDEVWWIAAIVLAIKVSAMVRAVLPYDPGDTYDPNL